MNNHAVPSQSTSSSNRTPSPVSVGLGIPDRRSSADNGSPAPSIVVVSAETHDGSLRAGHFQERHSLIDHGGNTPPRATTLNRLRAGPKDTIPMVGKPPRKQRSSRFVVTEKVDIERLPPFMGRFGQFRSPGVFLPRSFILETPPSERPQLFVKKLHQCRVLFDFNDASAELKGKQIKAQTLHEMLEYITTQRGVVTENIYPEVVSMVRFRWDSI